MTLAHFLERKEHLLVSYKKNLRMHISPSTISWIKQSGPVLPTLWSGVKLKLMTLELLLFLRLSKGESP